MVQWFKKKKKNSPAKAGDTGDKGLIPGPVRSPEGGNGISIQYSYIKKITGTDNLGGLQSMGSQRVRHN